MIAIPLFLYPNDVRQGGQDVRQCIEVVEFVCLFVCLLPGSVRPVHPGEGIRRCAPCSPEGGASKAGRTVAKPPF